MSVRNKHERIVAVCLFIIMFGCSVSAEPCDVTKNPCNGTGAPDHCIPPPYPVNATTNTTASGLWAPSLLWSDTIGEYQARVGISGDGRSVIAGSDTGTLRMYDRSGKVLWTVTSPNTSVYAVAISGNGGHVAASFSDPAKSSDENEWQVRFFEGAGNLLWTYSNRSALFTLAMTPKNSPIIAAGGSSLTLLDLNGRPVSGQLLGIHGAVVDVTSSGDGELIAAAVDLGWRTRMGEIVVYDRNGSMVVNFPTAYQASAVRSDRHGEIFTAVDDYRLYSFYRNGTSAWNFSGSPPFRSLAMTPDGNGIVTGSQYFVRYFDKSGAQLWNFQNRGYFSDVDISDDGSVVVAGGFDGIYVFSDHGVLRWHFPTQTYVSGVAVSETGDYCVAGTSGTVMFFNRWGNATVIEPDPPEATKSIPATYNVSEPEKTRAAPLPPFVLFFAIGASAFLVSRKRRKIS
jgi:WD40 repeat protein